MPSNIWLDGIQPSELTDLDLGARIAELQVLVDRFTLAPPVGNVLAEAHDALTLLSAEARRRAAPPAPSA